MELVQAVMMVEMVLQEVQVLQNWWKCFFINGEMAQEPLELEEGLFWDWHDS